MPKHAHCGHTEGIHLCRLLFSCKPDERTYTTRPSSPSPLYLCSLLYSITRLLYCTAILRHQRRHHLRTVIGRTDTALHRLRMMYITYLSYVCLSSIAPRRHRLSKLTWPTFQQRYFEPCNKSNEAQKRTLRSSGEMCIRPHPSRVCT